MSGSRFLVVFGISLGVDVGESVVMVVGLGIFDGAGDDGVDVVGGKVDFWVLRVVLGDFGTGLGDLGVLGDVRGLFGILVVIVPEID